MGDNSNFLPVYAAVRTVDHDFDAIAENFVLVPEQLRIFAWVSVAVNLAAIPYK